MSRLIGTLVVLVAIAWPSGSANAQSRLDPLAGRYFLGDGLGYNLSLELQGSGQYRATDTGCMATYGTAKGRWIASGSTIHFMPTEETGTLKGHLRQAHFTRTEGKVRIEHEADDARSLGKDGKSKYPISRRRAAS